MRILLILLILLTAISAPATATETGWVIEQTRALNGRAQVYTSDKGRRFENGKAGYELVSAPPDWNVYLCNGKKKIYFPLVVDKKLKVKSISLGLIHGYVLNNASDIKWSKIRSTKYMGHPVDIWHGIYDGSKIGTNGKSGAEFAYMVDFWVASDVTLAPSITEAYHLLFGWPANVYGLPLRCMRVENSNKKSTLLETQSFKPASNSADMFHVPKGYKLTHNEMDIFMNMDSMSDLLDDYKEQPKKSPTGKTAK